MSSSKCYKYFIFLQNSLNIFIFHDEWFVILSPHFLYLISEVIEPISRFTYPTDEVNTRLCSTQNSNVRKYKSWLLFSPIAFPILCCSCRFHSVNMGVFIFFYQNLTFWFWPKYLFCCFLKRGVWFLPIEILFLVNEKKQFGFHCECVWCGSCETTK